MQSHYKLKNQAQALREEVCRRAGLTSSGLKQNLIAHFRERSKSGAPRFESKLERLGVEVAWLMNLRDKLDKLEGAGR